MTRQEFEMTKDFLATKQREMLSKYEGLGYEDFNGVCEAYKMIFDIGLRLLKEHNPKNCVECLHRAFCRIWKYDWQNVAPYTQKVHEDCPLK